MRFSRDDLLGYVLSRATTRRASFEPIKEKEDVIREGMLVIVHSDGKNYLAQISSIKIYHEFYEEGEIWSETIRLGKKPPEEVARKYTIAYLQLLGILSEKGLVSVDKPPKPGSSVYAVHGEHLSSIYKYDPSREAPPAQYIAIGGMYGYERHKLPVVLDLRSTTMHLAVVGITGSGKSNTVGKIIEELGSKKENFGKFKTVPVFVIDANADYKDYFEKPELVPTYDHIYRFVFQNSEIARRRGFDENSGRTLLKPIKIDLNSFTPSELAELIIAFYHAGRLEGAELQLSYLTTLLSNLNKDTDYKEEIPCRCFIGDEVDSNCVFNEEGLIENLIERDRREKKERVHAGTADAVRRAIEIFREKIIRQSELVPKFSYEATITHEFIDELTNPNKPGLAILDLSPEGATVASLDIKQFLVSYVLTVLFNRFVSYRMNGEDRLLLLVMEEAQNYAPNVNIYPVGFSVARKILASIATQGRKFGLSLCLVTQRPSYVDPIVMSMINTYIVHRVAPSDVKFVDQITGGLPYYIRSKLTYMERGLAVIVGQMNIFPYPLIVKVDKRKSHKMGQPTIIT